MSKYFDKIKNDKQIITQYEKIRIFEDETGGWAYHDYNHVLNVANIVKQLLESLNYDEDFIDEALVAAILHDTGCLQGKDGHSIRSYEYAKKYFKENQIKLRNEKMVLEAIKKHSDGFDTNNIIQTVIVLADKIDIKRTRISKAGCEVIGNRQYQYIEDINIKIEENQLTIKFICDNQIDLKETEEYYFTKKVFKAIKSFAEIFNLEPEVIINDKKWQSFYKI